VECLVQALASNIATLLSANTEITQSETLLAILAIALEAGNFLNSYNNNQGAAVGFSIDTVLKLSQTKSQKNSKTTLLHTLARWGLLW
jgi:hypothetical protein